MAWTEEDIQKLLADGEAAEKIVNEYGSVLAITSKMTYGAPRSLLPRPKEEIKQMILTYLFYLHVLNTLDKNTFDFLQTGYASLSSFLDDDDAKIAVAAQGAMNSKDFTRMTSPGVLAALERFTKSTNESTALSEEFYALAAKLGIRF